MISNQCTYNTYPLSAMLSCDHVFAFVQPTKRKRSFVLSQPLKCSSYDSCCEEPVSKKRCLPAKKSVRFAEESNTVVFKMVSFDDLRSAWYHAAEIASFKQDSKRSVYELYRAGGDFSKVSRDHCIRGLEHVVTPTAAMIQKRAREERVAAVLIQQQLQRETSTSNPELLKLISHLLSQSRCEDAARMGAMDARIWNEQQF